MREQHKWTRAARLFCLAFAQALYGSASGAVVLDGSLGAGGVVNGPNHVVSADRGRRVGRNLFHSFSELSIARGQSLTFSGPPRVRNVLARVTGGERSVIRGRLGTSIEGGNLYLINPAGVIFGSGAQLDLSGAFAVTTADVITLRDGGKFAVSTHPEKSVLTTAAPGTFGFSGQSIGPIRVAGTPAEPAELRIASGQTLSLIGGNIRLERARLIADGGTIRAESPAGGSIAILDGSIINVDGVGGGRVIIRGGELDLRASSITSMTLGDGEGIGIDISLDGRLEITDGGLISAGTTRAGRGGDVSVAAETIRIDGLGSASITGIKTETLLPAEGDGGGLRITAKNLWITRGGEISTGTFWNGDGGNLAIHADDITIDADGSDAFTGIRAESHFFAEGNVGDALVRAKALRILRGGQITADMHGRGRGGDLTIAADRMTIDPMGSDAATHIAARNFLAQGDAGEVNVSAGTLRLIGGGEIVADVLGGGQGGDLTVSADDLGIEGPGSGIRALSFLGGGDLGDLRIEAGRLRVSEGGSISAGTFGDGDGGDLSVIARRLVLDGARTGSFTGISASTAISSNGDGGNVTLRARSLQVLDGARISTDTSGTGKGGQISVRARRINLDGRDNPSFTGITADSTDAASGDGGSVMVRAGALTVRDGARISTDTFASGDGGQVRVQADRLRMLGVEGDLFTGIIANTNAFARGDGGTIDVQAGQLELHSGARISASTLGAGRGGDVFVEADRITLHSDPRADAFVRSGISASSTEGAGGAGGDLSIVAAVLDVFSSDISTASAQDGGRMFLRIGAHALLVDSAATARALGNGGSLTISSSRDNAFLILNDSVMDGRSGDRRLKVDVDRRILLLKSVGALILADNPALPPDVDLSGSLVRLEAALAAGNAKLEEVCARLVGENAVSSFLVLGRGGTLAAPGGWSSAIDIAPRR